VIVPLSVKDCALAGVCPFPPTKMSPCFNFVHPATKTFSAGFGRLFLVLINNHLEKFDILK